MTGSDPVAPGSNPGPPANCTREKVRRGFLDGKTGEQIAGELGLAKSTVSYHRRNLGKNKPYSRVGNYDWVRIQKEYEDGLSFKALGRKYGFSKSAANKAIKRGSLKKARSKLNRILDGSGEHYSRYSLKRALIERGILKNECQHCQLPPVWCGRPLVMILDHINGRAKDCRLENLRLLCPNCNSQTDTFSGRNIGRGSGPKG